MRGVYEERKKEGCEEVVTEDVCPEFEVVPVGCFLFDLRDHYAAS